MCWLKLDVSLLFFRLHLSEERMRLTSIRQHLSIPKFGGVVELSGFTLIIGLNGAGKSHFLQAIASGAVHSDVLGPVGYPQPPLIHPAGAVVPGVRLLRSDDPAPEGLTVGQKTEPNHLFQVTGLDPFMHEKTSFLAHIRERLLTPIRDKLEEALGGRLTDIDASATVALRMRRVKRAGLLMQIAWSSLLKRWMEKLKK